MKKLSLSFPKFKILGFFFAFLIFLYLLLMLNYPAREFVCYSYADMRASISDKEFVPFPVSEDDPLYGAALSFHQYSLAKCRGVFLIIPDLLKK